MAVIRDKMFSSEFLAVLDNMECKIRLSLEIDLKIDFVLNAVG